MSELMLRAKGLSGERMTIAQKVAAMTRRGLLPQPDSDFDGVAVMLVPQDDDIADLKPYASVEPEHLHTTLVFYGSGKDLERRGINMNMMAQALKWVALRNEPVEAKLGGVIRFSIPDADDAVVLSVDSKEVIRMRARVIDAIVSQCAIEEQTDHGYTPHMTLGYIKKGDVLPVKHWEPKTIFFDRIRIGFGGEEIDLPLDETGFKDDNYDSKIIRRVRTPRGKERYKQPIESIILPGQTVGVFTVPNEPHEVEDKAVPLKCKDCGETYFTDDMKNPRHEDCPEKKDVYGGAPGLRANVQHDRPVDRARRYRKRQLRARAILLSPNKPHSLAMRAKSLLETKDEDQCPNCGEDYPVTRPIGKDWHHCPNCKIDFTGPGDNVTVRESKSDRAKFDEGLALINSRIEAVELKARRKGGHAIDGDGDGFIYDGTPRMRPAPKGTPVIGDLVYVGKSQFDGYHTVQDGHAHTYEVGPYDEDDGSTQFVAVGSQGIWDDVVVQEAASKREALTLLDARTRKDRKAGEKPVYGSLAKNPTKINIPKSNSTRTATRGVLPARKPGKHTEVALNDTGKGARGQNLAKDDIVRVGTSLTKHRVLGFDDEGNVHVEGVDSGRQRVVEPGKVAKSVAKKTAAPPPSKRGTAAKKTTTRKTTAATVKKRAKKAAGPSAKSLLAKSGGNSDFSEKEGRQRTAALDVVAPKNAAFAKPVQKGTKEGRQDPNDYQMKNGKPVQTEALRIKAHLASSTAANPMKSVEKAKAEGREFKLAEARDNQHLWFPKDPNSPVAYSYRQQKVKVDKNGDAVRDKNGKAIYINEFGPRKTQYTAEETAKNSAGNFEKVLTLAANMHKLDAALKKDAIKNTPEGRLAGSVLLMRTLGIRPNSMSEEAQGKSEKSPQKRVTLKKMGIDPDQPIYGATSLQVRHVKFSDDGKTAYFDFIAKEHVRNTLITNNPDVLAMLKVHMKGKSPKQPLFPGVNSDRTNKYIDKHLPGGSNKNLRTFVATQLAVGLMKEVPAPTSQEEFELAQAKIAYEVSLTLNNVARQALNSYIAPAVWNKWKRGIK